MGGGNPSLSPGRATSTFSVLLTLSASIPLSSGRGLYLLTQSQALYRSASSSPLARHPASCFDVDNDDSSASIPLSPGHGLYLPTQSQASYRSASSSPLAHHPTSCFDVDNEETDARENVVVADWHADTCASAAITDVDNDDDADDGNFDDTLGESFCAPFMATLSLDLELAFCVVDANVNLARTHLLSPLSPFPPLPPPPSLLLLLLLLGSPSEIQEFSLS